MNNQTVSIEGLTYERLHALISIELNYNRLLNNLDKKEDALKEKYKQGTYYFEYGERHTPYFKKYIKCKKDSIDILAYEFEESKTKIENKEKEIERMELTINRLKEKINSIEQIARISSVTL